MAQMCGASFVRVVWMCWIKEISRGGGRAQRTRQCRGSGVLSGESRARRTGSRRIGVGELAERRAAFCCVLRVVRWRA